jgi:hypothetical protein
MCCDDPALPMVSASIIVPRPSHKEEKVCDGLLQERRMSWEISAGLPVRRLGGDSAYGDHLR